MGRRELSDAPPHPEPLERLLRRLDSPVLTPENSRWPARLRSRSRLAPSRRTELDEPDAARSRDVRGALGISSSRADELLLSSNASSSTPSARRVDSRRRGLTEGRSSSEREGRIAKSRALGLPLLVSALVVVVTILASSTAVRSVLSGVLESVEATGLWGIALFVPAYALASVLALPGSLLTLGAGAIFGPAYGTLAASAGSVAGAAAAFLLGRSALRRRIERRFGSSGTFRRLDRAVARDGLRIVFLTRLSPVIPFNVQNYVYGLTKVRFRDYLLASWIGMLPGTVLYVYAGSLASDLAQAAPRDGTTGTLRMVVSIAGILATIAAAWLVGRLAKRALEGRVEKDTESSR